MDEVDYLREQKQQEREPLPSKVNGEAEPDDFRADSVLVDASGFQSGIERHEFVPDDRNPDMRFIIWLRMRVLKGSEQSVINQKVTQLRIDAAALERLQNQLARLKPDHRVERNEATLRAMAITDKEFKDDEDAYWDKREKIQGQIDEWMKEYADAHARLTEQINAILAKPNFYQTLRAELFNRVIHDHTIALPLGTNGELEKVDFSSSDPRFELSDELAGELSTWIWDRLKKKGKNARKK